MVGGANEHLSNQNAILELNCCTLMSADEVKACVDGALAAQDFSFGVEQKKEEKKYCPPPVEAAADDLAARTREQSGPWLTDHRLGDDD